ncbi:UNKNOWN [Stylonychia lemnae]|uniref:Uncharacterized protein n=1 Tax=Stylonychia lemnae TaxID=5949 RepID=A0A077ZUN0_STYLE|nr:UNKNOWN [Stylonychia lemnae]|eukprot:CDW73254.1 UNKNOWN [Stylonychia lemnae]
MNQFEKRTSRDPEGVIKNKSQKFLVEMISRDKSRLTQAERVSNARKTLMETDVSSEQVEKILSLEIPKMDKPLMSYILSEIINSKRQFSQQFWQIVNKRLIEVLLQKSSQIYEKKVLDLSYIVDALSKENQANKTVWSIIDKKFQSVLANANFDNFDNEACTNILYIIKGYLRINLFEQEKILKFDETLLKIAKKLTDPNSYFLQLDILAQIGKLVNNSYGDHYGDMKKCERVLILKVFENLSQFNLVNLTNLLQMFSQDKTEIARQTLLINHIINNPEFSVGQDIDQKQIGMLSFYSAMNIEVQVKAMHQLILELFEPESYFGNVKYKLQEKQVQINELSNFAQSTLLYIESHLLNLFNQSLLTISFFSFSKLYRAMAKLNLSIAKLDFVKSNISKFLENNVDVYSKQIALRDEISQKFIEINYKQVEMKKIALVEAIQTIFNKYIEYIDEIPLCNKKDLADFIYSLSNYPVPNITNMQIKILLKKSYESVVQKECHDQVKLDLFESWSKLILYKQPDIVYFNLLMGVLAPHYIKKIKTDHEYLVSLRYIKNSTIYLTPNLKKEIGYLIKDKYYNKVYDKSISQRRILQTVLVLGNFLEFDDTIIWSVLDKQIDTIKHASIFTPDVIKQMTDQFNLREGKCRYLTFSTMDKLLKAQNQPYSSENKEGNAIIKLIVRDFTQIKQDKDTKFKVKEVINFDPQDHLLEHETPKTGNEKVKDTIKDTSLSSSQNETPLEIMNKIPKQTSQSKKKKDQDVEKENLVQQITNQVEVIIKQKENTQNSMEDMFRKQKEAKLKLNAQRQDQVEKQQSLDDKQ